MKKVLAIVAVVAVVCVAGAAFANQVARPHIDQRRGPQIVTNMQNPHVDQRNNPQFPGEPNYNELAAGRNFGPYGMPRDFGGRGRRGMDMGRGHRGERMMFATDMPEEIKAKAVEAEKLRIDLRAALSAKPIDKAKAMEIFSQIQKVEQDVKAWKFGKRIENIEAFRTQMELNRNVPPVPAPKPETPAAE